MIGDLHGYLFRGVVMIGFPSDEWPKLGGSGYAG
jgi:hypothetical protein